MAFNEERPLIQGIGDEVLLTLLAFCTILACTIHFLSRRGYLSLRRNAANTTTSTSSTSSSTSPSRPSSSSPVSSLGDGLRRRRSVMETVTEVAEEEEAEAEEAERGAEEAESGSDRGEEVSEIRRPEGSLPVTVKYLDDRRRQAFYLPQERVEDFKERNFPEELAEGQWVRIVHRGRELKDHLLMSAFSLQADTVLHCVVTERRSRPTGPAGEGPASEDEEEAMYEPGQMLVPLFILLVCAMWIWALLDRSSFRPSSLVILFIISVVIVYALAEQTFFTHQDDTQQQQQQQQQQPQQQQQLS